MSHKTSYKTVIQAEDKLLKQRRTKLMGKDFADALDDNRFGIALSGGGIRSATINLGILKTLHKFGILKQADYLSTVSGGGYTGAYIQANIKEGGAQTLFDEKHIAYMRQHGEYLMPGSGWKKMWSQLTLVVAFAVSFLMSLVSPAILVILVVGLYFLFNYFHLIDTSSLAFAFEQHWQFIGSYLLYSGVSLFALHYIFNISRVYQLNSSKYFNYLENIFVVLFGISFLWPVLSIFDAVKIPDPEQFLYILTAGFILILLGFITNPNATSFHRFYRKQLADAFLHFAVQNKNIELHKLFDTQSDKAQDYTAPYPLINTCLNLQSSKDPGFVGAKASDYFLLSPLYCGAKLVGYVPTKTANGYRQMTLPAAATISAAAVNPGMGAYSNKLLSILLTLFNLRLGFWTWNPKHLKSRWAIVWWPFYFFYELLGRIGTDKKMINISDGGHIENLGVMELLRRKCKLIIAVDAGADPKFTFADLENLTVRARNELGVEIRFREGNIPEDIMRVNPSHGYSKKRLAIADIYQLWEKKKIDGKKQVVNYPGGKKIGVFVYVKSAVTAPKGRPNLSIKEDELKYKSYNYKIYNPEFPHQSTADQFFDPVQWEAYFQLGQFIGADILSCDNLNDFQEQTAFDIPLDELYKRFDENQQLFGSVNLAEKENIQSKALDEVVMDMISQQEVQKDTPINYEM